MRRWCLGLSACGLLGWYVLGNSLAYGQDEVDPFNVPEDVLPGEDEATNGEVDQDTPPATRGQGLLDSFGFGTQLTPEQLEEVDRIYAEGAKLADEGDLSGALQKFADALEIHQRHYPSYYSRGLVEREQGLMDRAILSLGTAINLSPTRNYELYLERGKTYLDAERHSNAIGDFQTAQMLNATDPEILYWLGKAQAEFGYEQIRGSAAQEQFEAAVASLDLALKMREDYPEALFERGSARLQLGQLDEALEDLQRAVELDPEDAESAAQLGFASLQRANTESMRRNGQRALIIADFQNAVDALTKYFSLLPDEVDEEEEDEIRRENVYVARAMAFNGLGDEWNDGSGDTVSDTRRGYYQRAIRDARASQELEPDLYSSYFQEGIAHRMLGDFDAATDAFTEALERQSEDTESMLRRGIIFFRQGDYELALSDFLAAGRYRINPRALFWTGLAHARLGDYQRATVAYSEALRYQSVFPLANLNRGLAYMKLGRFERAIVDFNEVLRRDRTNETARLNRGLAYMELGRFERAIVDFNEVLRRDRTNETARSLRTRAQRVASES